MISDKELNTREILARAYKWFGVKAPRGHTFAVRDDYMMTMKAYSAWVRQDKEDNADWWIDWNNGERKKK